MRLEVLYDVEAFAKAVVRPTGAATKDNFGGYVSNILKKAAEDKQQVVDFQGLPEEGKNSEMFQAIGVVEDAIMNHIKNNEYPEKVRVFCDSEAMCNMYKVVYNFYYADTKPARMDVEE